MITNDQVNEIEDKLRQAQKLVEECGAAICGERAGGAPKIWNDINSASNDISLVMFQLWQLRPED